MQAEAGVRDLGSVLEGRVPRGLCGGHAGCRGWGGGPFYMLALCRAARVEGTWPAGGGVTGL